MVAQVVTHPYHIVKTQGFEDEPVNALTAAGTLQIGPQGKAVSMKPDSRRRKVNF